MRRIDDVHDLSYVKSCNKSCLELYDLVIKEFVIMHLLPLCKRELVALEFLYETYLILCTGYCRIDGESLKSYVAHWPTQYWHEYEPLLTYCRENGVRLVACGLPLEVLIICVFICKLTRMGLKYL